MRRTRRRVAVLCVCCLVGLLPLMIGTAATAATAPYSGTTTQWNLSGYSLYKGSTTPADKLYRVVIAKSPLPQVIVTNETCSTQYNYLAGKLANYGYSAAAHWSIPNLDPTRCPSFGNAIFWRGTATDVPTIERFTYSDAAQIYGASTSEKRNMICVRFQARPAVTGGASPQLRACGTHVHQDDVWATRQLAEAKPIIDARNAAGPPTLVLGDLNMVPSVAAFNSWYASGSYLEADGANRTSPRRTVTSGAKLDYGFVPAGAATVTAPAKIEFQLFSSDHAIYTMSFALKA